MTVPSDILSFTKALASADRLRIVGLLSRGSKTASEIADGLGLHLSDVARHIEQLRSSGVVHEANGIYELDEKAIESLARGQFKGKRSAFEIEDESPNVRKILKSYLNSDGTIRQIPSQANKLMIILNFIVDAIPFDSVFAETEVNTILRRFHVDTAALRRYLVDYGYMARESDGSAYWRLKENPNE